MFRRQARETAQALDCCFAGRSDRRFLDPGISAGPAGVQGDAAYSGSAAGGISLAPLGALKDRVALQARVFVRPPRNLVRGDHAPGQKQRLQRVEPALVVGVIAFGDLRYKSLAKVVPGISAIFAEQNREAEGSALPRRGEDELAVLSRQGGLALEVGDAVVDAHRAPLSAGMRGRATPIMQSRVTMPASCSSVQPSVPCGRCGSTM